MASSLIAGRRGGLKIRSAQMLAPYAFLSSAASTLALQQSILPDSINSLEDHSIAFAIAETKWLSLSGSIRPGNEEQHLQNAWDKSVTKTTKPCMVFSKAAVDVDVAASVYSVNWLHAPPIDSVGLRLSDEAVRVAVAHRLEYKACEPHTSHDLCCQNSGPRHERHHQKNEIIWCAIKRAQIPAAKEPVSLMQQDGKRSDSTTLLPWARGKPIAWDVTVPDTYAESRIDQTAREACSAANKAAANKIVKYGALSASHIFSLAVETAGTWNQSAIELIHASLQPRNT